MLRFLLWRLLGLFALLFGFALGGWLLGGGLGRVLRGSSQRSPDDLLGALVAFADRALGLTRGAAVPLTALATLAATVSVCLLAARWLARSRRRYVRLRVDSYRGDSAAAEAVVQWFHTLHKRMLRRWWRRLVCGQPGVALEIRHGVDGAERGERVGRAWLALCCPHADRRMLEAALRGAYPNCRLTELAEDDWSPGALLRLKKDGEFIRRVKSLDHFEHQREPPVNGLLTAMGATGARVLVQICVVPAPVVFERFARRLFKQREERLSRSRREGPVVKDRSMVEDAELRGGLDVQHRPLFFVDIRIAADDRATCESVASELRAQSAENRLVERGTAIRHGALSLYRRRLARGEGNPLAPVHRGVFATTELAAIWHLPSIDYTTVPFTRAALPVVPASPSILRPLDGTGSLRDAIGRVSIDPSMRKQNTAVPGAVEQGKSSYLVATVAEDLSRSHCAVIVLDPKGDAADAVVSLVAPARTCTLLDFSHPTCGFNPLTVDAPADVIADYVVAALKNLFTDSDIRASSDRYLRNAIIAVLAFDRRSTLWDAARLLSVGEEGYAYRRKVGSRVRTLPEFKEISEFFTSELAAQLADARSMTTAKLDAPVNKLARLLNSASIKRVLLNRSLTIDFDRVIAEGDVLVVKGALGAMGAGNTSVLMQLLIGMLDAALARQQDMVAEGRRITVALKVDEAPLVINRGFAETIALKRSAGLETVACWQADAQWTDREIRDQLDALFAHRVYFATASARDARAAVDLMMPEFSDTVRPGIEHIPKLGRPDARLHLPKHHAIASWTTAAGRQPPFVAQTIPLRVDSQRIALHARRQHERGGRHLADLRQPHWQAGDVAATREATVPAPGQGDVRMASADAPASDIEELDAPIECSPTPAASRVRDRDLTPAVAAAPGGDARAGDARAVPVGPPAESYRELVELDHAQSVRWARRPASASALRPDALDLAMIELAAQFRHVLSSQLHRRFNPARSITTTQRRLKRLSDAGLVERFQFHRRDGGGVPMCYVATQRGMAALSDAGAGEARPAELDAPPPPPAALAPSADERRLRQARQDVHVAGWALAACRRGRRCALRGPEQSVLSPPTRATPTGPVTIGAADLRLPGGRVPHDFVRLDTHGRESEPERFETIRPGATIALREPAVDLIVERDDRLSTDGGLAKLARYDHFLTGWAAQASRYGRRRDADALVVFVCRDRRRARACALLADGALRACRAYAGEYPIDWQYVGRERIVFVAERDIHEGRRSGYGVARLPPSVRMLRQRGETKPGEAVREVEIP